MIVVDATVWVDKLRGVLPDDPSERIGADSVISPPHVGVEVVNDRSS